jgi:ubiquinone/menaquinone biosynthesis C-methylase UbiE
MAFSFQTKYKTKEFLRPEDLLRSIPLEPGMTVADFGAGNGHYAVAAGALVGTKGQVSAFDVMEDALSQTATLARLVGLHNITTRQCDLEKYGATKLPDTGTDFVILSSLLHQVRNRNEVLREAYRILKTGGQILVVEYTPDAMFGPPVPQRLPKEEAAKLLEQYSFRPVKELQAGAFHYALLYQK